MSAPRVPKEKIIYPYLYLIFYLIFITLIMASNASGGVLAAETPENESVNITVDADTIASLSCLDMSKEEIERRLNSIAEDQINRYIERGEQAVPNSVRNAMAGEKVNVKIGSVYFGIVTDTHAEVQKIQTGDLNDPTIKAKTDCQTVKEIVKAKSERRALEEAISRGEITWEGVTASREVATEYGGKMVQSYHILTSENSTGSVEDATDGFTSGLLFQ